jgi:hypothetical protein
VISAKRAPNKMMTRQRIAMVLLIVGEMELERDEESELDVEFHFAAVI